jgi:hypothetical protein
MLFGTCRSRSRLHAHLLYLFCSYVGDDTGVVRVLELRKELLHPLPYCIPPHVTLGERKGPFLLSSPRPMLPPQDSNATIPTTLSERNIISITD